tara:strand:+ start:898 stop:1977 length:1080 start_codon:yes stop_codon:yes gene_type:complete
MNQKIALIGAGLFGITIYLLLKKGGFDCTLFEKNNDILKGASTNNLNRVHFGFHYPRDFETAKQSLKGYKSFKKFYTTSVLENFDNYYFIAKSSKVNFNNYLKFCKKNNLKFKKINLNKFNLKNKNLEGGIKVNEAIYDWQKIKKNILNKLKKFKNKKIRLNEEVLKIDFNKKYKVKTSRDSYDFDIIIDASYEGSNKISKKISKQNKYIYQQVIIYEFVAKNFIKMGLALMDGNFFSFLPKGQSKKHILYHVVHSVLKKKICKEYPSRWKNKIISKYEINNSKKKILNHIKMYFPNLRLKLSNSYFLSPRILPINLEKTDKRVSKIVQLKKGYYKILSAKVDHSVDIANEMLQNLKSY